MGVCIPSSGLWSTSDCIPSGKLSANLSQRSLVSLFESLSHCLCHTDTNVRYDTLSAMCYAVRTAWCILSVLGGVLSVLCGVLSVLCGVLSVLCCIVTAV